MPALLLRGPRRVGTKPVLSFQIPEARPLHRLRVGDALICRGGKGVNRDFIRISGRGAYYHVAVFAGGREPTIVEMSEIYGGHEMPWEQWLAERDDYVDVFRPGLQRGGPHFHADDAVAWMRSHVVNQPYGVNVIRRFARQASWLTCWWNRPCTDVNAPPPASWVCSTAAACGYQYGGGIIPVFGLWPGDVQPTELARGLSAYVMTCQGGQLAT